MIMHIMTLQLLIQVLNPKTLNVRLHVRVQLRGC